MKNFCVILLLCVCCKAQEEVFLSIKKCCPSEDFWDISKDLCVKSTENLDFSTINPIYDHDDYNVEVDVKVELENYNFPECNQNQSLFKMFKLNDGDDGEEYLTFFENETLVLYGKDRENYEEFCMDFYGIKQKNRQIIQGKETFVRCF